MPYDPFRHHYTSSSPAGPFTEPRPPKRAISPLDEKPPWQPDWLLVLIGVLVLLTLFLIWYVNIPRLL